MKTISKPDFALLIEESLIPACLEKGMAGPFVVMAVSPEGGTYANWRVESNGEIRLLSVFCDESPFLRIPVNVMAVGDRSTALCAEYRGGPFLLMDAPLKPAPPIV